MPAVKALPSLGLRGRLLLLVLLALLPGVGLVLLTAREQRLHFIEDAQGDVTRRARFTAARQTRMVDSTAQVLRLLARLPEVREADPAGCPRLMADLLTQHPHYLNLGVIELDGLVSCSGLPTPAPVYAADRDYFQRALASKSLGVGGYQIGRITGKPSVNFGYPVLGPEGAVRRVVFAALDLSWLFDPTVIGELPDGGVMLVVDGHGTILAQHPGDGPGRTTSGTERGVIGAILQRGEGWLELQGPDAVRRLYAFSPVVGDSGEADILLAVGIPTEQLYEEVTGSALRNLTIVALVGVLTLLIAWVSANLLVLRPVRALHAAAERLREGDLNARTGLEPGGSEIHDLAAAMDTMAESLQGKEEELRRANAELEDRVRERTAQLSEAKASVERERALLESINHSLQDGLLLIDSRGSVAFANPRAVELLSLPLGQVQGRALGDLCDEMASRLGAEEATDFRQRCEQTLQGAADGGAQECSLTTSQGLRIRATLFPVLGEEGSQRRVGILLRDVTAETELAAARLREERSTTIERLAGSVAHEILNPLGALLNALFIMKSQLERGEELNKAHLRGVEREAMRIHRLIRDLLAYSEPPRPQWQEVDLGVLLGNVLDETRIPPFVEVDVELEPGLPPITGDSTYLHQALGNVMVNALEAMPHGGRLSVVLRQEGGEAVVELADTGMGILPEVMARIFEPLFTTKSSGGFGLGLPAAKTIVEAHGGRIDVVSQPGRGSTFTVHLPLGRPAPERQPTPPPGLSLP